MIGKSKTVIEAKALILKIKNELNTFDYTPITKYKVINWGNSKQQGKRINGMITGGMSGAPKGIKKYPYISLSEYKEHSKDFKYFCVNRAYRYITARKFGCNHIEAMYYAIA